MVRLNKYLSDAGICSRREADRLIENGQVTVDGVRAVPGTKVEPGQEVHRGQELASILDPLEGEVISRVLAPTDGIVYFAHSDPLVMEGTIVFKIIRRLHE